MHFIPAEGNAECSVAFGTRDVGVGDETLWTVYIASSVHVEIQNILYVVMVYKVCLLYIGNGSKWCILYIAYNDIAYM